MEVITIVYVGSLRVGPGDTTQDAIDTYLDLRLKGLTNSDTTIDVNDASYPVGLFNEDTIDLFKLGLVTVSNLHTLLGHGVKAGSEEYKRHANFFVEKLIAELKDNPYKISEIIESFDEVMLTSSEIHMFDNEDRERIAEQLRNLKSTDSIKK